MLNLTRFYSRQITTATVTNVIISYPLTQRALAQDYPEGCPRRLRTGELSLVNLHKSILAGLGQSQRLQRLQILFASELTHRLGQVFRWRRSDCTQKISDSNVHAQRPDNAISNADMKIKARQCVRQEKVFGGKRQIDATVLKYYLAPWPCIDLIFLLAGDISMRSF